MASDSWRLEKEHRRRCEPVRAFHGGRIAVTDRLAGNRGVDVGRCESDLAEPNSLLRYLGCHPRWICQR